ncbi:MAG: 4Fe-4S binding protein [Bacteroidales bacterium]|nr:4Fe-4S binding protein [Bacteroidales bacterium]
MKREIIKIDEEKCNGCGLCIPACPEGALQIIDGKARLVSDLMCDGLGACIGDCPEGAIEIELREAEAYNETMVMKEIIGHGFNTVVAHLKHLSDHGETDFFKEALDVLQSSNDLGYTLDEILEAVHEKAEAGACTGGCPGSAPVSFDIDIDAVENAGDHQSTSKHSSQPTALRQWPVQLHLLNPNAPYFKHADVLLAADCSAYSLGNFHTDHLRGKTLAIACPKLDSGTDSYVQKLIAMIDEAQINTLQVMIMEVPCCSGLLQMAQLALSGANRKIPIKKTIVGIKGDILNEEWV